MQLIIMTVYVLYTRHFHPYSRLLPALSSITLSMDYALDVMGDMYSKMDYEEGKEAEYTDKLIDEFCESLTSMIGTDGEITVSVTKSDIKTGTFEIVVEETYEYKFKGRKGYARCERAVVLSS